MPATATAFGEADLKKARKHVSDLEAREHEQRQAAEQMVANMRAEGKEPLDDPELFKQVDAKYREADETAGEVEDARQKLARVASEVGQPMGDDGASAGGQLDGPGGGQPSSASWGERVVTSEGYQQLVRSGVLRSEKASVSMQPVEVASRDEVLSSGLFRAQVIGSHGPLVPEDQRLVPPLLTPQREIQVIDLIMVGSTDSDTVEYAEETSRTPAAGGTAFGTALGEFDVAWQRVTVNVRRRGAMHTATRGNLADQGQLRTILNDLLDEDVRLEAEDQVVGGDGTGENWTGIYNTAGIGSVAGTTGEAYTDALHRGLTTVRLNRRRDPEALLIHPNDHETVILSKDGSGAYRMGSATQSDRRTIWGLTAVPSTVATETLPLWGRFQDATLWQREGITVSAYDQHSDYASRGLVLIVAEHRGAFRVRRPSGFCTVDFSTI